MIRRTVAQLRLAATLALALLCVAAARPKNPEVRRAQAVSDNDLTVAYETHDPGREDLAIPRVRAVSVLVEDARTGEVLYEKNADAQRAAASTQKLLTALIVAEEGYLDQNVTVRTVDTLAEPVRLNIKSGDTYQRIDLLRALLVKSPNDVARCLARDNAGSIELFAQKMNAKARELGATHSNFVNPNGLPMPDQYSTARDLAIIARRPTPIRRSARSFVFRSWFSVMPTAGPANLKTRTRFLNGFPTATE